MIEVSGGRLKRLAQHPVTWYVLTAVLWTLKDARDLFPNNFLIFRTASENLIAGRDLYIAYPQHQFDLYKYSPTFALLMLPFLLLPLLPSLIIWNVLSAAAFASALGSVAPERRMRLIAAALVWWSFIHQIGGAQTNAMVAALMIATFVALERHRAGIAALAMCCGASIKLFPLAVAPSAVMYPDRRRFVASSFATSALLVVLPALLVGPAGLVREYTSWRRIEHVDAFDRGYSVMGMLHDWFRIGWPNWTIQLAGTVVLLLPLIVRRDRWAETRFRRHGLASVLMYVVLFNHQAEYQSYLIAATGLVIWFLWSRRSLAAGAATGVAMVALHPFPYLIAWLGLQAELLRGGRHHTE